MVSKSKKVEDDLLLEQCKNLSYDMSNKVEELGKQRDSRFLSLTWFLIATCGIIITSWNVTWSAKCCLTWSIICLVLWWFFNSNLIWAQILKVYKSLQKVFPIPNLKTNKEKLKALEEIENWIKANKKDIFFSTLVTLLQNAWIVLFIVGLFIYL